MKLSFDFPMADPFKWLKFYHPYQCGIHPVFAAREAAFARDQGKALLISSGRRLYEEQCESYKSTGGYQDKHGDWVGGNGMAAVPGVSWHEWDCATDWADIWARKLEKDLATDRQLILGKYGIYKPLTKGNKTSIFEDWHVQPVETRGIAVADRHTFAECRNPEKLLIGSKGDWVKLLQIYLGFRGFVLNPDGDFGSKTRTVLMEFQKNNGLKPDGVVGPATWSKILYNK